MSSQAQQALPKEYTSVHFQIPASDPAAISKFYGQLFEWQIAKVPDLPYDYWLIHLGGTEETIGGVFKRQNKEEGYRNYILVRDIDAAIKKATDLGAKVIFPKGQGPGQGFIALLTDPNNNVFGLWQPS